MMEVMGMGPKKATLLYKKLKIKNIKELEQAIKKHKLKGLPGFGSKTEENILKGLDLFRKGKKRMLLGLALPVTQYIIDELKALKEVHKIEPAGSLRRKVETIGDIDILITSPKSALVMNRFTKLPDVARVIAKGPTKSTVILKNRLQADIRVVPDKSFGAALQYFTGNKEHNIKLRQIAIKKSLKLSEYGLFNKRTNKLVAGKSEQDIYRKLGLLYIEPELRENTGEIEAAKKRALPKLVTLKDIKGDFHIHSKWSDGDNTIEQLAKAAKQMGYEWICITDHSKTSAIAHGLKESQLLKQINEIKKLNKKIRGIRILAGSEVDIKADGSLDYSNEVLKKLDIVTAAVHSGFKMSEKEMTKRVVKALENKYVNILEHPTGRIISKRPPYAINLEKIFSIAKSQGKFLEINSQPERLDLKDVHVKSAIKHSIKLVIGTDAHSLDNLRFMELGVATARRGWAERKDILNTLSLKQLEKVFKF